MTKILLVIAALTAAGCAAKATPRAAALIEADPNGVAGCKLLGTVRGGSMFGGAAAAVAADNAMIDAREKAAKMGATHLVFLSVDGGNSNVGAQATARAYACEK